MVKQVLALIFSAMALCAQAQPSEKPVPVMVLSTFHFSYPNLDLVKVDKKDQIDVMDEKRQAEIAAIVARLKKINPTKVVIEAKTLLQPRIDKDDQAINNNIKRAAT